MKAAKFLSVFVVGACFFKSPTVGYAQSTPDRNPASDVPRVLSYQGLIESPAGTPIADGVHRLSIRLYTKPDGAPIWQEDEDVRTAGGLFNALLGAGAPLPSGETMSGPLWLGVSVEGGAELPRTELTAAPYALNVPNGSITAAKMGTPYVGSMSINGQVVSTRGGNVNFTSGSGISLAFDPTTNAVLIGANSTGVAGSGKGSENLSNTVKSITGTQNQVLANGTYGTKETDDVTLTLPQDIGTGSSPSFSGLTLSSKATSAATASGDASSTLTTKGYVDNAISTERTARESADDSLRTNLSNEISTRTSQASTYLLLDGTRPMSGALSMGGYAIQNAADPSNAQDAATKNYVDVSAAALQSAINTESTARAAGDNTLSADISNESARAVAEEAALQSNISAETSARESADNTLTTNLNTEVATRTSQGLTYLLLDGTRAMTGTLDMGSNSIHNILDPSNAGDAASKNYVDTTLAGLSRDFIQNGTSQQTANFNISGNGTIGGNFTMSGGSLLDAGTTGSTPASGSGVRLEWIPSTASFRAGYASSTQWDNSHIGFCSDAMGNSPQASGSYSLAMGYYPIASGSYSVALGANDTALNIGATALGYATLAAGAYSTSLGYYSMAMGTASVAIGRISTASGAYATALGNFVTASGNMSTALGSQAVASGSGATAIGNTTTASGTNSTALGQHANTNSHPGAFVYGDNSTSSDILAGADNEFDVRAAGGVNFFTASDLSTSVSFPANGGISVTGGGITADNGISFGGALMPSGSAGSSGQVLASAGSGNPPTWVAVPHWVSVPASSSASGNPGDEAYDSNYLYVCVSANTWKRVALSSW